MRSAAKHVVSFLTVMIPIFHCQAEACVLPLPGKCSQNDYTAAYNTVCPSAKASCSFSDGQQLCDYKQGCRDPEMTNWTVVNGTAQAKQTGTGSCGGDYYYSVLESPWLEFTVTSCLKFRYRRYRPAALDVFLSLHNGSVITILDRTGKSQGTVTSHAWTVNTGIWKIKFRAYGGGTPGSVEVHSVSWSLGRCESSGATASDGSNRNVTAPGNSGSTTGDCKPLTTMTTAPPTASTNKQDTASRSTSLVISSSGFSGNNYTSETPMTTSTHTWHSGARSTGATSDDSLNKNNRKDDSGSKIAAIAGAAGAAAVVTAVAVVAVVFLCRRRRLKSEPDKDKDDMEDMSEIVKDTAESNASGDTSVGKSHSTPSPPPAAVGYVNVGGPTSNSHDEDIDPYDLEAEDGAPGKNRNSSRTDYNGVHTRGALKQNVGPPSTAKVVEDDYNHMISAKSTPQSRGVAEDDYSHIDNPQNTPQSVEGALFNKVQTEGQNVVQPNPNDTHSVVNEKDKTTTPSKPNPNDVYSVVNKKGKTPTPTQPNPKDVYSVVNKKGKTPTPTQPNPNNVYSVVKKDKKPKVADKPNTPNNGLLPDEYNTLSFNEARKELAKTEERGATRQAYDLVQTDPADLYSKAQTGKRNIVIDSDYDHVKN